VVAVKRGGYLKRRTRLRPMSERRKAELSDRRVVVAEVRARDRDCQARYIWPEVVCRGPLDVHERIPRSAWRGGWLVVGNCLLLCRAHHDEIDRNDETLRRAVSLGLHGYSWEAER